jgi:PAS domain S-box-containing protein
MPGKVRVGRPSDLGDRTFFFEIIPDLVAITGFDGYVRDANTAWQSLTGWSRKELLATPLLDFIHPEDRLRMGTELERVQRGIFMMFLESRFQCKDGAYKRLVWKAAGMPARSKVYLLGREIAPSPRSPTPTTAPEAERSHRHLALALRALQAGSWEIDVRQRSFWGSSTLAALLGLDAEAFPSTSRGALGMVADEDRPGLRNAIRVALDTGQASYAVRVHRPDGTLVALKGAGADGRPALVHGVAVPQESPWQPALRALASPRQP